MKKLLSALLLPLLIAGCSTTLVGGGQKEWNKPGKEHLKIKAVKSKILRSRVHKERKSLGLLGYAMPEITPVDVMDDTNSTTTETVFYDYISDIVATNTPYFEGRKFSNAEVLKEEGESQTIAFYAEDNWVKETDGNVYVIVKDATTTLDAFVGQTGKTVIETVMGLFSKPVYAIDTYNSSGTYTPPSAGWVEAFLVGGGGGGGAYAGGGGAAGGVQYVASSSVTVQAYTVTVGQGGAGGINDNAATARGYTGSSSSFNGITALGGGGGGSYTTGETVNNGLDGGSGGGGSGYAGTPSAGGTGSQGKNGGIGKTGGVFGGGGGGGNTANGDPATASNGGNGGNGTTTSISGSSITYACGAGGGLGTSNGTVGAGGCASAGNGGNVGLPTAGAANRGGGGGGSGPFFATGGAAGGSGIVILVFTPSGGGGGTSSSSPSNIIIFD